MSVVSRVAENGRLNLPSQMRRQVGLERGGTVSIWVENGEIRIRSVRDVMSDLQGEALTVFSGSGESVDGFIEEKRAEADRERKDQT